LKILDFVCLPSIFCFQARKKALAAAAKDPKVQKVQKILDLVENPK
jgi:hypothetical protein